MTRGQRYMRAWLRGAQGTFELAAHRELPNETRRGMTDGRSAHETAVEVADELNHDEECELDDDRVAALENAARVEAGEAFDALKNAARRLVDEADGRSFKEFHTAEDLQSRLRELNAALKGLK